MSQGPLASCRTQESDSRFPADCVDFLCYKSDYYAKDHRTLFGFSSNAPLLFILSLHWVCQAAYYILMI
ncbi:hypothetical protein ACTXT7_011790 [Hymenolepis weldensis]